MRVAIPFTGVDASSFGYGRTRSCPTFGAGYAAYMFGTAINDAPTVNLFTGANDGRLIGTPASIGLVGGPMATAFSGALTGGNLLTVTGAVTPWRSVKRSNWRRVLAAVSASSRRSARAPVAPARTT